MLISFRPVDVIMGISNTISLGKENAFVSLAFTPTKIPPETVIDKSPVIRLYAKKYMCAGLALCYNPDKSQRDSLFKNRKRVWIYHANQDL